MALKCALIGLAAALLAVSGAATLASAGGGASKVSEPSPIRERLRELRGRENFVYLFQVFDLALVEFARKGKQFKGVGEELTTGSVLARAHMKRRAASGADRKSSFNQLYDELILKPCKAIRDAFDEFRELVERTAQTSPSARRLGRADEFCRAAAQKETRNLCYDNFKLELEDATIFLDN